MKTCFKLLAVCLFASSLNAQPGVAEWRLFDRGRTQWETFYDVYGRAEGGYFVCGDTYNRAWMQRLDNDGIMIWDSLYAGSTLRTVIETDEGDAVAGGNIGGFAAMKVNCDGELIWRNTYAGIGSCNAVIELKGGGYVLAGGAARHGYITMVGDDGAAIWGQAYAVDADYSTIFSMRETDGGIFAVGIAQGELGDPPYEYGWLLKIDFEGNIIINRFLHFQDQYDESFDAIVSAPEGGFSIAGMVSAWQNAGAGFGLTHISAEGQVEWETLYAPGNRNDLSYPSLAKTSDGGYVISGTIIRLRDDRQYHPYLIRVDRQGEVLWTEDFNEQVQEEPRGSQRRGLNSVITEDQDIFVAVGTSLEPNNGQGLGDALFMKLESNSLDPQIIFRSPADSDLTVLKDNTIQFIVRAREPLGDEPSYLWIWNNDTLGVDTSTSITFDSLGLDTVSCQVSNRITTVNVRWHITVRDLFIRSFLPDTTQLILRRGTTQEFSLDVAATVGDPVNYNWWLTDLTERHDSLISDQTNASYQFLLSGDYRLSATAYRGESSDTTGWLIHVKSVVQAFWPRNLNLSAHPDTTINFGVLPFNQQSDSLYYFWFKNGVQIDTLSEVGIAFPDSGMQEITAIVMDGSESDTLNWTVSVSQLQVVSEQVVSSPSSSSLTAYPNPFNSSTTISFSLPSASASALASLRVYGIDGRLVKELVNAKLEAGWNSITWDASGMTTGIYFVRLETQSQAAVRKLILIR
jgi:hypothetical protein